MGGQRVEVATLWSDGLGRRECDGAVVVHRLEGTTQRLPFLYKQAGRPFHPPLPDPLLTRRLGRLVTHLQPDVVHGHSWMMFSALPLRRTAGFAAVATLNAYALLCPKKTLLYRERPPCQYELRR